MREETTSWLYFFTLFCTDALLFFIDWLFGVAPTSNVALLVDKCEGTFLGKRLWLTPVQDSTQIFWEVRLRELLMFLDTNVFFVR